MERVRGSRWLAAVVGLTLVAAACGGASEAPPDIADTTTRAPTTTAVSRPQIDRLGLNDLSSDQAVGNPTSWYLSSGAGQLAEPSITMRIGADGFVIRSDCSLLLGSYAEFETYAEGVDVETSLFIQRNSRPPSPSCDAFESRAMEILYQALFHASGYRVDDDEVRFFVTERDVVFSREPVVKEFSDGLDQSTWRVVHVGERHPWARERTGIATTQGQLDDLMFATREGAAADIEIDFEENVALLVTDARLSACTEEPVAAVVVDEVHERMFTVPTPDVGCEIGNAELDTAVVIEVNRSALPAGRFVLQRGPHEVLFGFPGERRVVLDDLSAPGTEVDTNDIGYAPIVDPTAEPCCDTKIIRGQFIEESRTFHQLDFLAANGQWWQASTPAIVANPLRQWFPVRSERADLTITYIGAEPIHLRVSANDHIEQYWPFESAAWWTDPSFETSVFAPVLTERLELARPDSPEGWVQAEVLARLLRTLNYEVPAPAENQQDGEAAYQALATSQLHLWPDGQFPGDESLLTGAHVRLEGSVTGGGLPQGWLITKAWADEAGITTMDQINADPALYEALDRDDDGKGEFFACPLDWSCSYIQAAQTEFAGWNNMTPLRDDYDELWSEFLARVAKGQPAVAYVWTPSTYFPQANVGVDTMWLSVEDTSVLDDSNPLDVDIGDTGSQISPDGTKGFGDVDPETCLEGPDGCQLGWLPAEINAVANAEWLRDNPKAEALLRAAVFTPEDMSFFSTAMAEISDDTPAADVEVRVLAAADDWIAANNDRLEEWIAVARTAR